MELLVGTFLSLSLSRSPFTAFARPSPLSLHFSRPHPLPLFPLSPTANDNPDKLIVGAQEVELRNLVRKMPDVPL